MICDMIVQWRLQRLGVWSVVDSHDLFSVFGCTKWDNLARATDRLLLPRDRELDHHRYSYFSVRAPSTQGPVLLKPSQGGGMGDAFIVLP